MVDRGADLSWLSQYPFEQEILFPPLTCLEVVRMRVLSEALIVEVRPVVNQSAQTIEAALAKLQRSHVQLLDIMLDDFRRVGVPLSALAPLEAVRRIAEQREPSWFNRASSFKAATESAFVAKLEVFNAVREARSWTGPNDASQTARDVAERMCVAAELCAFEGEAEAAADLLCLSIETATDPSDHPRLGPTAASEVESALCLASSVHGRSGGGTSADGSETEARMARVLLLAAHYLVDNNLAAPWADTLVVLVARGGEVSLRGFVRGLLPKLLPEYSSATDTKDGDTSQILVRVEQHVGSEGASWLLGGFLPADAAQLRDANAVHMLPYRPSGAAALLRAAARVGNIELLNMTIPLLPDTMGADEHANTPLHLAAQHGHSTVCARLLSAGALRDVPNANGATPYELAVATGARLAWQAISPSPINADIAKARDSADHGAPILVAEAAQKERNLLDAIDKQLIVCKLNGTELADELNAGIASWSSGVSALTLAASQGYAEATTRLLECKADPQLRSACGASALIAAVDSGSLPTVHALLHDQVELVGLAEASGRTPLHHASERGFTSIANVLLEAKAVPDVKDSEGFTPLMLAAQRGHMDICVVLTRAGASAISVNSRGQSALRIAVRAGHAPVVQHLLRGDVEHADPKGRTLLAIAAMHGRQSVCRVLLQAGARIDAPDEHGAAPLHHASRCGHDTVVANLGGDHIDAADRMGCTALHYACAAGQLAVAETLIRHMGAKLLVIDSAGRTPLMLAVRHGHVPTVKQLLEPSTQSDLLLAATDGEGRTSLEHARELQKALLAAGASRSADEVAECVNLLEQASSSSRPLKSAAETNVRFGYAATASVATAGAVHPEGSDMRDTAVLQNENARLREELAGLRRVHAATLIEQATAGGRHAEAAVTQALHEAGRGDLPSTSPADLEAAALAEQARLDQADEEEQSSRLQERVLELLAATKNRQAAEELCGPRHPTTLVTMYNEGKLLKALGELSEACAIFESLLAFCNEVHGTQHSMTLNVTIVLAGTMQNMGRLESARPLCEAALLMSEKMHGAHGVSTIVARGNLANLSLDLGDPEAARRHFEAAFEAATATLRKDHPVTLRARGNYADLLRELGRVEDGLSTLGDAPTLAAEAFGPDHPLTLSTRAKAARLLLEAPPESATFAASTNAAARAQDGLRELEAVVQRLEVTRGENNPQTRKYATLLREASVTVGAVAAEEVRWQSAAAWHDKHAGKGHQVAGLVELGAQLGGLEWVIGSPDVNLGRGIRDEHCERADSMVSFVCLIGSTRPSWEYFAATDPAEGQRHLDLPGGVYPQYPGGMQKRRLLQTDELEEIRAELNHALNARQLPHLGPAEFGAARLYTGVSTPHDFLLF